MSISRKEFLFQGLQTLGKSLLRPASLLQPPTSAWNRLYPPGFRPEKAEACRGCDRCVSACPDGLLRFEEGGCQPLFEPARGGCTFCLRCAEACPAGVLSPAEDSLKLGLAAVDNSRCLCQRGGCFSCLERCPHGALTIAVGTGLTVAPDLCTGCGSCHHVCPLSPPAITVNAVTATAL